MTPVELSRTVLHAVRRAVDDGVLSVTVPERAVVTPPGPGGCGDYATNIALQLARPAGQPPLGVAEILRARLLDEWCISDVVVTGPGFLNLSLAGDASTGLVEEVLRRGRRYGHADGLSGNVVLVRCPAEVRAVVSADALARVLRSQGDLVRIECEGGPPAEAEWESVLGVDFTRRGHVDFTGQGPHARTDRRVDVRPVPAPADPLPLGRDAARWALLHPAPHDRPRITRDHLVQRENNPLFRVRYAHARTRALLRNARDLGFQPEPGPVPDPGTTGPEARPVPDPGTTGPEARPVPDPGTTGPQSRPMPDPGTTGPQSRPMPDPGTTSPQARPAPDPDITTPLPHPEPGPVHDTDTTARLARPAPHPATTPLLALLGDHPRVLAATASHRSPDRLARHLIAVADATLPLLSAVLPVGEEKPSAAHRARLALAEAAGAVLAGGLSLLGIDAPEHL
ncbi:ArgS-related anticodon-binding protein NrtL [Streptomyces sp. NPDC006624]|uniref:ArgS-related anticodon-binding protein NrtL n=1 Tax=Streptomyces sp. NPDC006624 TaxID=3154892 RepID=UPI0033AF2981